MKPFRPELFIMRMLAVIFAVQACFLAVMISKCPSGGDGLYLQEDCPRLAARSHEVFQIAIATCLSLLGGAAVTNYRSKVSSLGDPDASASQLPQPPSQPSPEGSQAQARAKDQAQG